MSTRVDVSCTIAYFCVCVLEKCTHDGVCLAQVRLTPIKECAICNRLLATTSADQTCCIWRTADLSLMTKLRDQNQRWVWDCAFSGDSQYIITGTVHLSSETFS